MFDKVKPGNKKEDDKVAQFYGRLALTKEEKAIFHQNWNRYCRLYKGDQWDEKRPSWKVSAVNNISFALIESMLPLLLDGDPVILTEPQTEDDMEASQKINLILKNLWNKLRLKAEYTQTIRDSLKLGTGMMRVGWDPKKYNGMGEITAKSVDPYDIFVDPNATTFDNAQYLIYRTKLPLTVIADTYDNGSKVKSDFEYFNDNSSRETLTKHQRKEDTIATVYEEWHKVKEGMRLRVFASGILLEEKINPFELNERFPFIPFFNYKLTGELWGYSELANLESLQKENNKIRSLIVENLSTMSSGQWIVDTTAGIEKGQITSRPGQVIYKSPAGKVEKVQGLNLPSALYEQLGQIQQSMEYNSGIHPISFGISPGSVTAGTSLSILTENAQTRIRGKLRNFEDSLTEVGEWFVSLIRQFYTEPRVIKLSGDEGFQFEYFDGSSLRQEQEDEEGKKTTLLVDFDVNVIPGSSLRVNRSARYQQAMEMYNAGALDPETLIEKSEIGDTKQIVERLIKYGRLEDPNDPQVKIDKIIKALTDRISFNVSSTDPTIVQGALQEILENEELLKKQMGVVNEATPEGQEMKAKGMGQPNEEEVALQKQAEQEEKAMAQGGGLPPEGGEAPVEGDPEMLAMLEELAQQGVPQEEAMAMVQERLAQQGQQVLEETNSPDLPPEGVQPEVSPQGVPSPAGGVPQEGEGDPQEAEMLALMEQLASEGVPQEEAMAIIEQQFGSQASNESQGVAPQGVPTEQAQSVPQEQAQGVPTEQAPMPSQEEILELIEQLVAQGIPEEEAVAMVEEQLAGLESGVPPTETQGVAPVEEGFDEQTMAILQEMAASGVPEETMEQIVQLLQQGMGIEEVLQMIEQQGQGR